MFASAVPLVLAALGKIVVILIVIGIAIGVAVSLFVMKRLRQRR